MTHRVMKALKTMFAIYGTPDVLLSNNGLQLDSTKFTIFAKTWKFQHKRASPRYPQFKGKVKNAVKTIEQQIKKCHESGQSEYLALLDC